MKKKKFTISVHVVYETIVTAENIDQAMEIAQDIEFSQMEIQSEDFNVEQI